MTDRALLPPLALTMGDPAGCGPQITAKAWQALRHNPRHTFAAIGPPDAFTPFCPVKPIAALAEAGTCFADTLPVLDPGISMPAIAPGNPNAEAAPAILGAIEKATALCLGGEAAGIVTNPINKALLYGAGFAHPGHTEFLAALCASQTGKIVKPVMMLVGGGLRVALATIHMPLVKAAQSITTFGLVEIGQITHAALKRDFGLPAPRIVFTGLNPHAGENGTIGREEIDIINPAAAALRADGIDIADARPGDTVFAEALAGEYDAIIAMTHDQGLIPVKTLDFWGGVNVTLGLPIIRTSPDHGTAYDAAAAGTCREDSLVAAIRLASANAAARTYG